MQIFLNSNSFVTLISSAAEGIPDEVLGLLFGEYLQDDKDKVMIQQATPLQFVERTPNSVECNRKYIRRVHDLWDSLTPYWPIGDFHSHPYAPNEALDPSPSKTDEKDMKKGELGLIISIKKTPKQKRLKYDETGFRISGTISYYRIEIASWYCKKKGKIDEVQLRCPFIDVLNMGYRMGIAQKPGLLFSPDTVVSIENMRKLRIQISNYEKQVFRSNVSKATDTKRKTRILLRKVSRENK